MVMPNTLFPEINHLMIGVSTLLDKELGHLDVSVLCSNHEKAVSVVVNLIQVERFLTRGNAILVGKCHR